MRISTIVTTLGLALVSATASAQDVTYDYDKATDFSKIKTYAWIAGTNLSDEFNHKRIVTAIDAQLTAKGLTQVAAGATPDMLVAYHAAFDKNLQINASSFDSGPWRYGGNRSGSARVEEIVNGTLVVDLVDAKTETLIWRGIAKKDIDTNAKPEKRDKNMNKAAEKLFKDYPPAK